MKRLGDLKPSRLAWLTILGGLLLGSIFVMPFFYTRHSSRIWIPIALAFFIGGIILMLKSVSALKDGIRNEQWKPEQIEPLRVIMESPFITLLLIALSGAFIALSLPLPHSHSAGWALFMPAQSLSQIIFALRQRAKNTPTLDFHSFAPISSEHWGQR